MSDNEVSRVAPTLKRGGIWVRIGDEEYRVPPLSLRDIQDLQDEVESLKGMTERPTSEQLAAVTKLILRSLQRNYPAMTAEDLDSMLDLGNVYEVLSAVLKVSGYIKSAGGAPSGEATPLTGTGSM